MFKSQKPRENEVPVVPSQLRPGMFIRIPGSWLNHGFVANSFLIADDDEIKRISAMNLTELFCDVKRSKVPPLPKEEIIDISEIDEAQQTEQTEQEDAKLEIQARTKAMLSLHKRLDKINEHYREAVKTIDNKFKLFDSSPKDCIKQVADVSRLSIQALLSDPDSAIILIAEKGHYDGQASHALSVMTLAQLLGKQAGLPEEALHVIGVGALLHDIGTLTFHSSIITNSNRNKFEESIYQSHCRIGFESALKAGSLTPAMVDILLHHHERYDGNGFPDQLKGEDIMLASRIVAIANYFDNLTNPKDKSTPLSPSEALSVMWSKQKGAFDNKLLQVFVRSMGVYPPGTLVQLTDNQIGVVIASSTFENPLRPQVLLYRRDIPRSQGIIIDLVNEPAIKIVQPINAVSRSKAELDYLLPRRNISWFFSRRLR